MQHTLDVERVHTSEESRFVYLAIVTKADLSDVAFMKWGRTGDIEFRLRTHERQPRYPVFVPIKVWSTDNDTEVERAFGREMRVYQVLGQHAG